LSFDQLHNLPAFRSVDYAHLSHVTNIVNVSDRLYFDFDSIELDIGFAC